MFTIPATFLCYYYLTTYKRESLTALAILQALLFFYFAFGDVNDPASDPTLNLARYNALQSRRQNNNSDPLLRPFPSNESWNFDLQYMNQYEQVNAVLRYHLRKKQDKAYQSYAEEYGKQGERKWLLSKLSAKKSQLQSLGLTEEQLPSNTELETEILNESPPEELANAIAIPTLWQVEQQHQDLKLKEHKSNLEKNYAEYYFAKGKYEGFLSEYKKTAIKPLRQKLAKARRTIKVYEGTLAEKQYLEDKSQWLATKEGKIDFILMPLLRNFHWQDDAGGEQGLNKYVDWWELTRINRKDLLSALIFGIRISLVVGLTSIAIALLIGIPIGSMAGYYGGKFDIVVFRLLEIWESMPTLFMLLLVVAIMQTKSIFLVITVIGIFGWTGFCRFIRAETLKQRNLAYVDACRAIGYDDRHIVFSHILPNAIPPLLTLLPFSIMGAITSEAGLSFLGLGEEGSCSWGVLMDEGRTAFPGESYLLWPPAILLTILLVAIALVGDALRDAFDPKMRH
jgi:peptide/nickel transport system permease protein